MDHLGYSHSFIWIYGARVIVILLECQDDAKALEAHFYCSPPAPSGSSSYSQSRPSSPSPEIVTNLI